MDKASLIEKHYNQRGKLDFDNPHYLAHAKRIIIGSLEDDIDERGDITTETLISLDTHVRARILAKQDGVIAGIEEACWLLKQHAIETSIRIQDGERVSPGTTILTLSGSIKSVLTTERVVLNVLQRMSGIASATYDMGSRAPNILLCATRKTHWGLLDKKAVVLGGGGTHRLGLYDFILIKDNHLAFLDDKLENKVQAIRDKGVFWEIEVRYEEQALRMAKLEPNAMMFDNFTPNRIRTIIPQLKRQHPTMIFEASGKITKDNIAMFNDTGVDVISSGALTHSSSALDIGLYIDH